MRRFFVAPEAVQDDMVQFDAELARHMGKVLRLNVGEQVTVSTGDGTAYLVELTEFMKDAVTGRIVERMENLQETAIEVVLYQGMPKGDKLELIIQKCTELGVSAVIPVETSRSVVHLDSSKAGKKLERWQKIAQEASQQ
ncbi:MAG: 16S rRNA (uracil(1498)-N(3))-methyltransferase, partial [Peptococcaceae bacterium]|nr:16S rRNA (uracil(1498)-N(3))-methyltransferase [Peptococcaceae bacterium]